jgi:hypothetical protein
MNVVQKFLSIIPALALALALSVPALAAGSTAPAKSASTRAAAPAPAPPEEHPQIRAALAALRNSKEHLEHAAHDFGGHRVEAIKAIDEAIRQLEICLQYDKH